MENIMGCEVISPVDLELPGYKKLQKRMNLNVLKVPVRMNGLTSSGTRGFCYYNVDNLVEVFGGKSVVGWSVKYRIRGMKNKKCVEFHEMILHGHAVWMTKEGNLVDPTAKSWMSPAQINTTTSNIWGVIKENGKMYRQYIPLKIGKPEDCYGCETIIIRQKIDKKRINTSAAELQIMFTRHNDTKLLLNWGEVDPSLIDSMIVYREKWQPKFSTWNDFCELRHKQGHFHEKSLATGKTLDEIRCGKLANIAV